MSNLNNTVIKNLTPEMGKRIIKKYQDDGWGTRLIEGTCTESNGDYYIYYGVIDGDFDNYPIEKVWASKARIIELDEEWLPVRGERVLVWDGNESDAVERIYLTTIEGAKHPIVTVLNGDESEFENGLSFAMDVYDNMKRIETNTELQELEAKYRELGEKIEQLKNKQ
jgi:hypothetical protein